MIDLRRDSLIYGRGEKSPSGLALKTPRESTAHAKSPGLTSLRTPRDNEIERRLSQAT